MSTYGILQPNGLVALVAIPIIVVCLWRSAHARKALASVFELPALARARGKAFAALLTASLLVAASMRPYIGAEDIQVPTRGDDVVFLVDISRSMYTRDVAPSRLEVAKRKIKDLVTLLSTTGRSARFGITVFAGDGYTVCPVTTDRGVLAQFIDIISPDLVSSLGSNLQAGIEAALSRVDEASKRFTRVIVLSDGEDEFLQAHAIVQKIQASGVRLDVMGVGTTQGAPIELPNGAQVVDRNRRAVVSTLHEPSLRALAEAGGGSYVRATLDDSDIQALSRASLPNSATSPKRFESSIRVYREIGPWLALVALIILIIAAGIRGAHPLAVLLVSLSALVFSQSALAQPSSAPSETPPWELYEQGDFAGAAKGFAELLRQTPTDRRLRHGLGSALFKLGRFKESEEIFGKLAYEADAGRPYFESVYNQGNALLGLQRYQDAIDAYRKALDVKPDDERSQHNLRVAQALLEEEKRRALQPTPTPTLTPTPTPSPSEQSEQQSSPSPSPSPAGSPEQSPAPSPSSDESSASPSPAPSAAPTGNGPPEGTTTPGGTPSVSPETGLATHAATASAEASSSATASSPTPAERLKEALDKGAQDKDPIAMGSPTTAPESSAFPEVDAWLQSLPDSPLLIRQKSGRPSQEGQTW